MIDLFLWNLERVFGWLVEASWQASVLVALVLVVQWIFRSRLNSRWYHTLWLLVILRLILPVLPESALSLFQFAPQPPAALAHSVTQPIFVPAPVSVPDISRPTQPAATPAYPFSLYTFLALLWLVGALGFAMLTWQVNCRFGRHVRNTLPVSDPQLLEIAAAARAELGLHRPIRLIESARVQGPAIMGLIHPTLILPEGSRAKFTDDELRFIFLHELAHLKRGDLFMQWLIALLQILHWFNPVLWYAFRRMRADREPATDALVLSRTGEPDEYGRVLIKLLEHYHQRHSLPTLVGILEDKDQFKRRFVLITKFTRGAYGWSLLGMLLLGVLAVGGLTKSKAADSSGAVETPSASLARDTATPSASSSDRGIVLTGYAGRPAQASPINGAIGANDYDTVKSLLDHGSNFDAVDVQEALRDGRRQIVALLWSHGPPYYCSELAYAVSQDQPIEKIVEILKKGSPVTPPEDTLITPLGLAAQRGNIPVVKLLLDHGADLHPADPKLNPLDAAAGVGKHPEMVDFLLQQGAQVTRWTLIQTIVWSLGSGRKPYEDSTHVMGRLIQAGALKGIPEDESALLLLLACQKQNPDILRQLLDAGLSPRSRFKASTGLGSTALEVIQKQMAPYPGDTQKQILDMLEAADKGASTNTNISSPPAALVAQARPTSSPLNLPPQPTAAEMKLAASDTRHVIGHWTRGPNLPADIDVAKNVIVLLSPKLPPAPIPANTDTPQARTKWMDAWYKTDEGKKYIAASNRKFVLHLDAAGTFSGERVEPGDYILSGAFWDQGQLKAQTQNIPVTVPKSSGNDSDAPVDIGYIVITGTRLDAYVTPVQPQPAEPGALVPQASVGTVPDEGRLYHALVYQQSEPSPHLVAHPYQFIADIRNTFPDSLGLVSLPSGASWSMNPVNVVEPANLVGAHYLYTQGFDSLDALQTNFPNGYYIFKITRAQSGATAKSFDVPVAFSGSAAIPEKAPAIIDGNWDSGALVLSPSSAVIHYATEPGVSISWEVVGRAGGSAGGWGRLSDGTLNLTGILAPGQTYDGQLRFVRLDNSMTVADPLGSSNCAYSTLSATIVQFTIKTP